MFYMVDNYDSFVYNLAAYLQESGSDVVVRRADEVFFDEIDKLQPEGIILSPGPKRPVDAISSLLVLRQFQDKIPILGVCLGHQVIGHAFGAEVGKGARPMHGKLSTITHDGSALFQGLPSNFRVTRYHSLAISNRNIPSCLEVCAWDSQGTVMAIRHKTLPLYGVQFHPEAVLSEYGHELLVNFRALCGQWRMGLCG